MVCRPLPCILKFANQTLNRNFGLTGNLCLEFGEPFLDLPITPKTRRI